MDPRTAGAVLLEREIAHIVGMQSLQELGRILLRVPVVQHVIEIDGYFKKRSKNWASCDSHFPWNEKHAETFGQACTADNKCRRREPKIHSAFIGTFVETG